MEVEKAYSKEDVVAKLRRLADALEAGEAFEIKVAGHRLYVPASAEVQFEYEQDDDEEELAIELSWKRKRKE